MIASTDKPTEEARAAGETASPRKKAVLKQPSGSVAWGPSAGTAVGCWPSHYCPTTTERDGTCEYPYWQMLCWGAPPVYRLMRNHPTIALARSTVVGPVIGSAWDLDWDDDANERAIEWVTNEILPLRRSVMRDAVRTVDYGYQPFAIPWEMKDGMMVPRVRALLPDITTILEDKHGDFAGVRNGSQTFNNLESWVPALDGEAGYKYGRSRYENIRDTGWAGWLDTMVRAKNLESKLSGIIPIVMHPPGGSEDEDGNQVRFRDSAVTALRELYNGVGVALETIPFLPEDIMDEPKLANMPLFKVDFLDAGSVSPAMIGFIAKLEYWDKLLFRGLLRGERTGLEAVSAGSRADSEQHTDTGTADSEEVDAELTSQFQAVVNTALRLNFPGQEGKIRLKAAPLLKRKLQVFRELMSRLVSVPELAVEVARSLDMDAIFAQMSLPQLRKFTVEAAMESMNNDPVNSTKGDPKREQKTREGAEKVADILSALSPQ